MTPATKREYLHQLVDGKNRWSRPLTDEEKALGFLGWHERGYLPHCDLPGLVQFVTFRLADSLPASRRGEWEHLLAIEDAREKRTKLEAYLDRGVGDCQLRDPRFAGLAEEAFLHRHMQTYELLAWCVMPNHVHVLMHVWQTPLWKLIKSWKVHVALGARRLSAERRIPIRRVDSPSASTPNWSSALRWQREYWDTFMRDEEQERIAVRYIESNPMKAKLCRTPEEWPFSSARFRDVNRRLALAPGAPNSNSAR
jgi:putative transposase